jgi:hypothetical protein
VFPPVVGKEGEGGGEAPHESAVIGCLLTWYSTRLLFCVTSCVCVYIDSAPLPLLAFTGFYFCLSWVCLILCCGTCCSLSWWRGRGAGGDGRKRDGDNGLCTFGAKYTKGCLSCLTGVRTALRRLFRHFLYTHVLQYTCFICYFVFFSGRAVVRAFALLFSFLHCEAPPPFFCVCVCVCTQLCCDRYACSVLLFFCAPLLSPPSCVYLSSLTLPLPPLLCGAVL